MKTHRFVGNFKLNIGDFRLEDKEFFNQFNNVLKLRAGEIVMLCDGKMNEAIAEIKFYGKNFINFNILEININKNEPKKHVVLYCSILKKENYELVVQKATEVGAKEIIPLITERTVKLNIRKDRLEKIIKEAAEQSGRGILPVLQDPISLEKAIQLINESEVNLFFDSSGASLSLSSPTASHNEKTTIFIGPEGGWDPKELKLAEKFNLKIVSLGKTTLRAETAAIIATYLFTSSNQ